MRHWKFGLLIGFCCYGGLAAGAPGLAPTFIVSGGETIVASAVIRADVTGQIDATALIQKALDTVAHARGGVVFLPAGRYRVDGGLTIGYSTTLMGEPVNNISRGTILLARNKSTPLLDAAGTETGLINLTVWYPEQEPGNIQPYPPTIAGSSSLTIRNLTLGNSYDGIFLRSLNASVLENIRGTVLHRGIVAAESEEFAWMHDIHFSNKWWRKAAAGIERRPLRRSECETLDAFTHKNLVGLELQRIDCLAIDHYSADNAATAVLLRKNPAFPALVFGFGGVVSDFKGPRQEEGWAPWYYFMHYANLDNVPEAEGKHYTFPKTPCPRRTGTESFIDTALPPYSAAGDGKADDTAALTAALADAGRHGGGTVYLRQGEYKITAPLVVPAGVELRGPLGTGKTRESRETCTLAVYGGQYTSHPETDSAALTLMAGSGVRGFTVAYPAQEYDAAKLHPFPYSIRGCGGDIWIVDMMLLNSFNGIDLSEARCDRHLVKGVWGTVFEHGVKVGAASAGGKLERITFSCGPWTEAGGRLGKKITPAGTAAIRERIMHGNTAFTFGDCRRESGWGLFAFEPNVHFHFKGCRDANFFHCMHDMARRCNVLADDGRNINLLGYFGTGTGEGKYDWLETGPKFEGPLNVYGKTILRNFDNHPLQATAKQVRFYDEVSLATGAKATARGTLPGSSPSNAVDRNCRTLWEAAAGSDLDVDLGHSCLINRVGIEGAGLFTAHERNMAEAELWVSTDGASYQKAAVLKTGGVSWADMPVTPVRARYVRLRVTKPGADGIIRVASFDVYSGSPINR